MKMYKLPIMILPLVLVACGDTGNTEQSAAAPAAPVTEAGAVTEAKQPTAEDRLKKEAGDWTKETKELSAAAWDATKEKSAEVSEKTGEYYDAAKEKSAEYYDAAKEKSAEYYASAKEKGGEYYEAAKREGTEVYEKAMTDAEKDMAERDGHPPEMESGK